jgi:S1-C subfamily serine protease
MSRPVSLRRVSVFGRIAVFSLVASLPYSATSAQNARQLAQNTFPSVVLLVMQDANGQPLSLGSGFFVADGVIVTNLHVVRGSASGQVKVVGQTRTYAVSELVGIDANQDIVLLEVSGAKAPPLKLSQGTDLAVGDVVYAVGNPEGLEGTFSQGIVSGFRGSGADRLLQITAPISPGSSGGPIINSQGEVVGVAVATYKQGQNLNFAVPVSSVATLLKGMGKPRPLSSEPEVQGNTKTASIFGSGTTEAVIGIDFRWGSGYMHSISFAVLNQTGSPVKDVHFLVVFYEGNKKHGFRLRPIDYIEGMTCPNEIFLPNLPKRQDRFKDQSICVESYDHSGVGDTRNVEIRVLDFSLAE